MTAHRPGGGRKDHDLPYGWLVVNALIPLLAIASRISQTYAATSTSSFSPFIMNGCCNNLLYFGRSVSSFIKLKHLKHQNEKQINDRTLFIYQVLTNSTNSAVNVLALWLGVSLGGSPCTT